MAYAIAWPLFAFQRLLLWKIPLMPAPEGSFRRMTGREIDTCNVII